MQTNKIIGREEEQRILERCFISDSAEFIGIYGRRRIGKTFLVKSLFGAKKNTIFLVATGLQDGAMSEQIRNFTESVAEAFFHKGVKLEAEKNWHSTFKMLNDNIAVSPKGKKIVLFFDEFPWLATQNSKLLQSLEYFWNQYWSQDKRIKLIICGSSSGWILKHIINNKGGLYNRVTKAIQLEPFNLNETKRYLSYRGIKLNNKQIAELYMVVGGIPYYLAQIERGLSSTQAIERLAFSKGNFLLKEFDKLFATLFHNAKDSIEIVRVMTKHRYGIGQEELFRSLPHLSSGGTLVGLLNDLEEAGFIISFMPKWHKRKGKYYKIIDEYTLFYFYWIEPLKEDLLIKGMRKGYWEATQTGAAWLSWKGYAFEAICFKHLAQIGTALNLSPRTLPSTWRYAPKTGSKERGAQIDLLFDRDDDAITVCEIKFTTKAFEIDKQYANNLTNKVDIFKKVTRTNKQIFIAIVSANGLKPTMYSEELVFGVVTLDDLFAN